MTPTWESGGWMVTASGIRAYPTRPEDTEIRIGDIAHALGRICRFGGHVACPMYSVAQHSVIVSRVVPRSMALAGLLHDAAEAYIGDIVKPFKDYVLIAPDADPVRALEARWWKRIAATFGVDPVMPPEIKAADVRVLLTERRDVMAPNRLDGIERGEPLRERIRPWCSTKATALFKARFEELTR